MQSTLKNENTHKPVVKKQFLVVKFIGNLEHQNRLRCISSNWLNSTLDRIVFVRYPLSDKKKNILRYLKEKLPVFCHWQTYLATVYYQTDNLEDALLYASQYTSRNEAQFKPISITTNHIEKSVVNELFFDVSTATRELTLREQFKIIRPLVISILRSIDLCIEEYKGQSQARRNVPHYEYLRKQAFTYAKFLQEKMQIFTRKNTNPNWTDAIDRMNLPSTSTSAKPDVNSATKEISSEIKTAIEQLLVIIDINSE